MKELISESHQERNAGNVPDAPMVSGKAMNIPCAEILESISDAFLSLDNDFVITYFNRAAEEMLMRKSSEVVGQKLFDAFPEARGSIFEINYATALREKKSLIFESYFGIAPYENWYEVRVYPQKKGISVYFQVTTLRKSAEIALRASEHRFRSLVDLLPCGINECDLNGRITFSNPAHDRIMGYDTGELIGKDVSSFLPDDVPHTKELFEWIAGHHPVPEPVRVKNRRKDGAIIDLFIVWDYRKDESGNVTGIISVIEDITEKRRLETALLNTKKLETVGILARGIAHDFNNLLQGITGNIDLAKLYCTIDSGKALSYLESAEKSCDQARELSIRLLTFAKEGEQTRVEITITEILRNIAQGLSKHPDITLQWNMPPKDLAVYADPRLLIRAFNNIISNAVEALGGKGVIGIAAEAENVTRMSSMPLREGSYVRIVISDNGPGISDQDRERIFDPYFTTKSAWSTKGLGLGLSIAHSIIQKHDGFITVRSAVGEGTAFTIYLPAFVGNSGEAVTDSPAEIRKRSVLVMDDDEGIRDIFTKMLGHMDFTVITAKNGEEAVNLYRDFLEQGNPFDLVILDLSVDRGMGGDIAVLRLIRIDPDVRAIIMSGYSENQVFLNYREHGFLGALIKPVTVAKLREVIDQALRKSPA